LFHPATTRPSTRSSVAIGAVASIRPAEAQSVLDDLADSDDEEIAEAVEEATGMAEAVSDGEDEEEAKSEWLN
jgi:hypothetical protein